MCLGGAEAVADTTGGQGSNLPHALSCTGCLGTCGFHTDVLGFWFAFETKFGLSSMDYTHCAPCIPHVCVANPFPSVSYVKGEKMKTQKASK